jgi:small subunit ribosomal protein S6
MKDHKHKYQIILILEPKLEDKNKKSVMKKVTDWLESKGVELVKNENLGVKELVYAIKGFNKGDFWEIEIGGEKPIGYQEFNLLLDREVKIIRYLILKI